MVATFSREEFLTRRWRYKAGQHVTTLGRTGSGKTMLMQQLLSRTISERLPVVTLVAKPRDTVVRDFGAENGLATARTWPPLPNLLRRKPAGWLVWPQHRFDPDIDDAHHWETFRSAILETYKGNRRRTGRILYVPDVTTITYRLHHPQYKRALAREMDTVWANGRVMEVGAWVDDQRPAWMSTLAYSSADHLFLAHEPDARYRKRFDEIGGIDPKIVSDEVLRLPQYHFLYVRREDGARCIIQP